MQDEDSLKMERDFHLMQSRQLAVLRIKEGRARVIDKLIFYFNARTYPIDFEVLLEPAILKTSQNLLLPSDKPASALLAMISNVEDGELSQMLTGIQEQLELLQPSNNTTTNNNNGSLNNESLKYWRAVLKIMKSSSNMHPNADIQKEIDELLADNSLQELHSLRLDVRQKLNQQSEQPIDVEYWEFLLKSIDYYEALLFVDGRIREEYEMFFCDLSKTINVESEVSEIQANHPDSVEPEEIEEDLDYIARYDPSQSPVATQDIPDTQDLSAIIAQEEFTRKLNLRRLQVLQNNFNPRSDYKIPELGSSAYPLTSHQSVNPVTFVDRRGITRVDKRKTAQLESIASHVADITAIGHGGTGDSGHFDLNIRGGKRQRQVNVSEEPGGTVSNGDSEEPMADIDLVNIETTGLNLNLKKPRFNNIIFTGYDWNRYNATHYDKNNPPPKVIQGYKFHIFYPDLLDKTLTPTYRVIKDPQSADNETSLLVFSAGPPYEDVAFRIVNKEWEYGQKRGFVCKFDRGTLMLHFRFRRFRR